MSAPGRPACAGGLFGTNIVLDLLIFRDPATPPLQSALDSGQLQWLATAPMREELARVLTYPAIVRSMVHHTLTAEQVLAAFDVQARLVPVAPKARVTCKDPDDQKFIDLAVAYQATLLSKDKAVLCMKKAADLGRDRPESALNHGELIRAGSWHGRASVGTFTLL